jgi:hypothetical protein
MLIGFSVLNVVLTTMIFKSGGQTQTYIGAVMLSIGALLAWLCIGTLHYSDSSDAKMAKGVSLLDSITLIFVIGHFCFLLYVQGHVWTLQSREADYRSQAMAYNEKAEKVSIDNAKIAEAARQIAAEETKRARIENDTVYQARKAAQAGAKINAPGPSRGLSLAPSLSTSPIELERPEKPKESSTDFLTRWDLWIRLMNFGELALAAVTFIYIRNRSARFNANHPRTRRDDEEFPDELDANVSVRGGAKEPRLTAATTQAKRASERSETPAKATTQVSLNSDDTDARKRTTPATTPESKTTALTDNTEGLKRLREALKLISFHNPGVHFKADCKDDCVWIRTMESKHGEQRTVASTKAALTILDDAVTMTPEAFRARLEQFLKKRGFPLNSETG